MLHYVFAFNQTASFLVVNLHLHCFTSHTIYFPRFAGESDSTNPR